mmetsp:Transcript_2337/g.5573  ORF Transcript_2337/g.5573 Transcript_2337/m.5573 type:complete len:465 (-) Transcript_2337:55-1449(-)
MTTKVGADFSVGRSTKQPLLLAGDIGGTNTRLALYDRDQDSSFSESSGGSRYNHPLFVKEYRNECIVGASKGGRNDDADGSEYCNENVQNFVRSVIAPFLEEAWKCDVLVTRRNHEKKANSSKEDVCILCCLGVAGPVDPSRKNGIVTTSQREYLVGLNGQGILEACWRTSNETAFVKACVVINDFVAQGYGCLSLSVASEELYQLSGNRSHPAIGPKFCVGAGTGFGSCYMVPTTPTKTAIDTGDNSISIEYTCFPSEYGQSDWSPNMSFNAGVENDEGRDDLMKLWKYLQEKNGKDATDNSHHISVEHVVSGIGLATAYECLVGLFPELANETVREQFYSESDLRGKVVGENVSNCVICKRAVEMLLRAYGSVVGSCAMSFLPTGGLYITGGLLLNLLNQESRVISSTITPSPLLSLFLDSYRSKGAASFLLNDIPLFVVQAKDTGLRGAAIRAGIVRSELD